MPYLKDSVRHALLLAAGTALCNVAAAAKPEPKEEHLFISDQLIYDDNLFRRGENQDSEVIPGDPTDPTDPTRQVAREDYSNRLTVGVGNDFHLGKQTLRVKARVNDVRFQDNDYLDYTGGDGSVVFDWRALTALSGKLSATYGRTLVDFAHTLGTTRDLIDTTNYTGSVRYAIGPRWSISATGGRVQTDHDLDLREQENLEGDFGRVSIDYATPTFHSFGIEYRYYDAKFPDALPDVNGNFTRDYEENGALARFTYTATVHTQFRVSGGYVERERPDDDAGRYSGNIWRAEIDWTPREKFSTLLAGWRELRAYNDVESDYFVSDGFSLGPTWSPTEKLLFALSVSYEDQEFLTNRLLELDQPTRNDDVLSGLFTFTYKPREQLAFELSYRSSDRDSNRVNRRYDAQTAGVSVRWSVF